MRRFVSLLALCGGLLAQQQKYADLNMGVGMIVIGIASVIIGEILFFGHKSLLMNIIAVADS